MNGMFLVALGAIWAETTATSIGDGILHRHDLLCPCCYVEQHRIPSSSDHWREQSSNFA
jgi:hypothetical protein